MKSCWVGRPWMSISSTVTSVSEMKSRSVVLSTSETRLR